MVWHPLMEEELRKKPKEGFGFVYRYIFEDGKSYIGHTRYSIQARHCKHREIKISLVDEKISELNYVVEILDEVPIEELGECEKYYIELFGTLYPKGYNKTITSAGHYQSIETKDKLKLTRIENPTFKGHKLSDSHKRALYLSKLNKTSNFKGCSHSSEMKEKVSDKLKGHEKYSKMKIKCVETNVIYESIGDASKQTGICRNSIGKAVRGIYETAGLLHWVRCDD